MKKFAAPLALLILSLSSHAGEPMEPKDVAGPMTRTELETKGFHWLKEGETAEAARLTDADAATKKDLKTLSQKLSGVDVEIYFASWCPDTHDQLPVLFSSLDASGAKPKSMHLFALDKRKTYPGYTNPRSIQAVPTFVFLKEGKEIGRFVETPKKSVLADLLTILK